MSAAPLNRVPRVLILSASSGAGHVRAGQALEQAFLSRGGCQVEHIDTLAYVSKLFQRLYDKAYISMVRRALMGFIYDRTDQPWWHPRRRLALDRLNTQPMIRMRKTSAAGPVHCHALSSRRNPRVADREEKLRAAQRHRSDGLRRARLVALSHRRSLLRGNPGIGGISCRYRGVPAGKVKVTGIPIDPVFEQPLSRTEARRKLRLAPDARVLLIAAGGYGPGPIEQLVHQLLAEKRSWQLVAIAGKSETLRKHLEEIGRTAGKLPGGRERLAAVAFTTEMDRYIAAADSLIGKAGGLTTSGALARGLPMVLIEPIPGQEERNADHLLEVGAAIRSNNLPAAAWKIATLLENSERLAGMRKAAKARSRPDAARKIVEDALGLLH
jgi:processive 1,2-diacylglycerol beta-glucosyltransferase